MDQPANGSSATAKARILAVDDEPDILESLSYVLQRDGYDVVTATNGHEALGAARACLPDLILLDVMLPKENGYRVARMIREDVKAGVYPREIPIVLLTARDLRDDPTREKLFMEFSRAQSVVYKPFDLDEILDVVETTLEAHEIDHPRRHGRNVESSVVIEHGPLTRSELGQLPPERLLDYLWIMAESIQTLGPDILITRRAELRSQFVHLLPGGND